MSNATNNEIVLANGAMESVDGIVATISIVDGVDAQIVEVMNNCTASLISEYANVTKGYFNMVSSVAIMLHNKFFKNIKGCKTINQYLLENVKCSKSTASELVKVATTYYNSKGQLDNSDFGVFTYSELVKLASQPEDIRKEVAEVIKCLPEHTRADVIKATDKVICKNILNDTNKKIEEIAEEIQSEKSDDKAEKATVTEKKPTTIDTVNYKALYEDIYKKLSAIDTKSATKSDIVKAIDEIVFIMVTNLEQHKVVGQLFRVVRHKEEINMKIDKYDFDLLKMYSSCKVYNDDNKELTSDEKLELIYQKLLEIESQN